MLSYFYSGKHTDMLQLITVSIIFTHVIIYSLTFLTVTSYCNYYYTFYSNNYVLFAIAPHLLLFMTVHNILKYTHIAQLQYLIKEKYKYTFIKL